MCTSLSGLGADGGIAERAGRRGRDPGLHAGVVPGLLKAPGCTHSTRVALYIAEHNDNSTKRPPHRGVAAFVTQ